MKTVNNYLKNVMKSVAYAAADVSEEYIPGIKEFTSTNKEFGTATYAALKNPSQFVQKQVQAIQESKVYKALDYGARNLSEDLRTGNFYNKARKERDELAFSGLDTNWDDLSEFGIDDDWESKLDKSSSKSDEITAGDLKIVESIEGSNAALANATVNAVIASSQNEIKNNRANVAMLYTQNERLFGGLHKDMTILGSTMQQMYKLQSASLQNIDKNMSSFFTQESKLSTERNAILKEMLEMQRNMYKSASDKEKEAAAKKKSNRIRWNDINVNGVIDINSYFGAVKKNINNQLASIMPAGFGDDSNMLATFMVSPLEGAMKYVVNGVIPATVKAAAKEFDSSVSGIFGNIIGELGNARSKNEGGLLGTIAKFFGVTTGVNRSIDTSKYEKGPVPFDGITRKAIIDVIPTHLRRIEAAITGRPEEMFDYKAGRWVKVSNVKKQFDDIRKDAVRRGTAELREAMNPGVQAVRKGINSKSDLDSFDKAIEEFEQFIYENNGRFNPNGSVSQIPYEYTNLRKHYSKIKTIYRDFDKIESKDKYGKKVTRNTKNSIRMKSSANVLDAKEYEESMYRQIESDAGNIYQSLFGIDLKQIDKHGKTRNGKFEAYNILKNTTDNLGNSIFDYLQNINKELTYIRSNGIYGGGNAVPGSGVRITMDEIQKQLTKSSSKINNYGNQYERISKSALDAIASGKAVDLRDFNEDEQAYLLKLSSMLSDNAVSAYKSEIKGYNENMISGFMDKHFIKTNIKSIKDVDEAIKKAEKEGKNTNEVKMDAGEEKFFKKIMNRIGTGETILGGIVGASSEAFTNLLYTADKAIYEMMYKTEISDESKQKYNGFLDAMVGKMSDKFKEISDLFKRDIIEPFKERFGIDDDFKGRFKDSLKNTGSRLWTAFKDANVDVYGPAWHEAQAMLGKGKTDLDRKRKEAVLKSFKRSDTGTSNITNANFKRAIRYGTKDWYNDSIFGLEQSEEANEARRVRNLAIRTGGEALAIWCERNGFTGNLDEKKVRLGSEFGLPAIALSKIKTHEDANKIFAKQFRHHARGTTGRPFSGLTTLTKGEGLISGNGVGVVPKTGVYNITNPTHIINTEDMHSITGGPRVSVQQALGKEKLAAKAAGFGISSNARGTMKITNNGVDIDTKEFLAEAKKFIPEAAGGGLIGGILSMILGIAGGPLLGAAVGAGGSIIASSDTLKNKLFGKAGEDGKRDGSGIISKSVINAFNKYFPDMAKYGLAGIIPGLLTPLGPIGGLMTGAAFGFLKNNERFTNKYFGEEGALHIKSREKKIIQDMLPGALKGATAGVIANLLLPTPFGIVGNAAIGSALGMMASTEEFKEGILGKEINGIRVGGIVNEFSDALSPLKDSMLDLGSKLVDVFDKNIVDPIARFITPAIHAVPQIAAIIPRKINNFIMNSKFGKRVEGFFKDNVLPLFQNTINKFIAPITKTAMSVITSPVRLLGWAGDKIRGKQIQTGNADYMTARERVEWMKQHGKGNKISNIDKILADIGTEGGMGVSDATTLSNNITSIISTEKDVIRSKRAQEKKINKILNNYKTADGKALSKKAKEKLREAMESGDMNRIRVVLSTYATDGGDTGLSKEQIDSLMNGDLGLGTEIKKYMNIKDRQNAIANVDKEQMEGELGDLFDKLGIDRSKIKDRHFMAKFAKNLETEVYDRGVNETGKGEVALETENNAIFKNVASNVSNIKELLYSIATGDTDTLKKLGLKHNSDYDQFMNDLDNDYSTRRESNSIYIGKDLYDKFNDETKEYLSSNSRNGKIINRKKATRINRDRELISKYRMTADEVNACNGKVFRLSEIMKEGFKLEVDAISMLNGLNNTQFSRIKKFIKSKPIRRMLIVRKITKDDIIFFLNNLTDIKLVANKCDYVLKNQKVNPKQFKSLEEVMSYEGNRTNVQQNGIGTLLLGAGKSLLSGAGSLIGSLFKKKDDKSDNSIQKAGLLNNLLDLNNKPMLPANTVSSGNTDEVDRAGDGKDILPLGDGYGRFRRDSSGNVQPDTSDSHTKTLLNKLELKEKMSAKVQEAQLKMAETIKANFDTSGMKESKGGKLGWLSLLLMGGLLWKSGVLKKVSNEVIKPLWTDHLKPWVKNTAVPWITDTAIPAIGRVFGKAISGLISVLPSLISGAIQGVGDSGYVSNVGNAAAHGFAKSMATGRAGLFTKATTGMGKFLTNRKSVIAKGIGYGTQAVSKPIEGAEALGVKARKGWVNNVVEKAALGIIDKAGSGADDALLETLIHGDGSKLSGIIKKIADWTDNGIIGRATDKLSNLKGKLFSKTAKETAENAAKKATANAGKNGGMLSKIINKAKDAISKLLSNEKVQSKLTSAAKALGIDDVVGWLGKFKSSVDNIFTEALEKGIKKVGTETCKKVLSKVLAVVFLVTDFLSGCDQAESILGVEKTSLIEEVVAGLTKALCNFLIIPSIFPGTNWVARKIYGLFNKDLKERQDKATEAYKNYVKETDSDLSKEEYLKRKNSVTGKVGGWISDGFKSLKDTFSIKKKSNKQDSVTTIAANATGTLSLNGTGNFGGIFGSIIGNLNKGFNLKHVDSIMGKAKEGRISIFSKDYWKMPNTTDNSFKGTLEKSYTILTKIMNVPTLLVKDTLEALVSDISDIESIITGYTNGTTTNANNTSVTTEKTTFGSKVKNALINGFDKIKSFFGFGNGSYKYGTGSYSKQIDPSIAGVRFNSSSDKEYQTIGNSGCGPAAAVNVLESMYGRGSQVLSAAKYALKHGYKETNGGTKPGFFADYFSSNGLSSQTSYNRSDIERNINSGLPTVLMGHNAKGTSSSSPFGRTPHYVTVTGIDGRGNAIVQDPESRYDNQLYPVKSLMKNTSLGVSAFGKNFRRGKYGRGNYDANIWWYLKQMGMTDAGAAGMMGNLYAESGLNPGNVENLVENFTGMSDAQYTAAVDSGSISKEKFLHPKGGKSQYGYGLAQWTSPGRKEGLYNLVKSKNVSISDIGSQLEWLGTELNKSYGSVLSTLKSTNSLAEASNVVLTKFERPANQGASVKSKRQSYGQKYLREYGGSEGTEISGTTMPQQDLSTVDSDPTATRANNIISMLNSILTESKAGQALSLFTGLNNDTTTTTADSGEITNDGTTTTSTSSPNTVLSGSDAANMVNIAKGEIGTKERHPNYVKYNDWFWGEGKGGESLPWCAAFVSWVANQAGISRSVVPKDAYTVTAYRDIVGKLGGSKVSGSNASPGDIIYFTKNGANSGIYHTGIVTNNSNGVISTVEGNSSNKVAARSYASNSNKILIARPAYKNQGSGSTTITSTTTSGTVSDVPDYGNTRGSNGIKPLSRYGQFKNSIYGRGTDAKKINHMTKDGYIKVEESYMDRRLGNAIKTGNRNTVYNKHPKSAMGTYGMAGSPDYSKLINSIISILMTIADNTDKLNMIVSILNNRLGTGITSSDVSNVTTDTQSLKAKLSSALNGINSNTSKYNTYADSIGDSSINYIISAMNAIASE